jgi:hypothetical protein
MSGPQNPQEALDFFQRLAQYVARPFHDTYDPLTEAREALTNHSSLRHTTASLEELVPYFDRSYGKWHNKLLYWTGKGTDISDASLSAISLAAQLFTSGTILNMPTGLAGKYGSDRFEMIPKILFGVQMLFRPRYIGHTLGIFLYELATDAMPLPGPMDMLDLALHPYLSLGRKVITDEAVRDFLKEHNPRPKYLDAQFEEVE